MAETKNKEEQGLITNPYFFEGTLAATGMISIFITMLL